MLFLYQEEREEMKKAFGYFTRFELALWGSSVLVMTASFLIFDRENGIAWTASLIGVTSLIFNAKANPAGQALMIAFSVIYGMISFSYDYYGEMLTYLCMTAPMAAIALVSWLKNPCKGKKAEVMVNQLGGREYVWMIVIAGMVTLIFYFVLLFFKTANIIPSTVSVTTSFLAVYLTFRRSPLFALAYAANDAVLIVLWGLASGEDLSYLSVTTCFFAFLINDVYGYWNWRKIQRRQLSGKS